MKKVFALILAVLLTAVLAVPAFAIAVVSPTQAGAPDVRPASPYFFDMSGIRIAPVDEYDGCTVRLEVTAYQDKDDAKDEVIQRSLNYAFNSYTEEFDSDARRMLLAADPNGDWETKYPGEELYVVNIFDITLLCTKHEDYGELLEYHGDHRVKMELNDRDASNFVALLHYRDPDHEYDSSTDGVWELIETTRNGNEIDFGIQCSNLSPFAIVAKSGTEANRGRGIGRIIGAGISSGILGRGSNGDGCSDGGSDGGTDSGEPTSPQTGEMDNGGYWVSCGIFFAAAGVTAIYRGKKEKRYVR